MTWLNDIGDIDAALSEQIFDIATSQGEPELEPDRVLDDRGWEAVAGVGGVLMMWIGTLEDPR